MTAPGCEVHMGDSDARAVYMPCRGVAVAEVEQRHHDPYEACRPHAETAEENGQRVHWYPDGAAA